MSSNRAYRLARRPVGLPTAETFELVEEPVGEPADGQVRVEVQYLSLDPAMRGWISDAPSYTPPVGLGEVMRAIGAGRGVVPRKEG
jgi:NADPH-dependent curcumin reductase